MGISITTHLVFLLEQTLHGITDRTLEAQQQEEEGDFLLSQCHVYPASASMWQHRSLKEHEEEEDVGVLTEMRRTWYSLSLHTSQTTESCTCMD